ncbi:MAG: hypothetical protein ACOY93_11595 [Bacillota bacterium]
MDRLIKEALEQRAAEVMVPPDAWERQRTLLATAQPKPWWHRWGMVVEAAALVLVMTGLVVAGLASSPARPGGGERPPAVVDPPAEEQLNPHVAPPAPRVVVAPDLQGLTPPQEEVIAIASSSLGAQGGQLTLSQIALADGLWRLEFRGDGRAFTRSGGPMPLDRRKGAYSHIVPVDRISYEIDAASGEIRSTETRGAAIDTQRTDLERYRGYVVEGGERTILRLVKADGSREGRDLTVWVPGQALTESGLDLWHLAYGTGRVVDVWGLTSGPGEVLAYRIKMEERPSEAVLDHDLIHGIPLPEAAKATRAIYQDGAGYLLEGYTVDSLIAWYMEQMPRYGWDSGKPMFSRGESRVVQFEHPGWEFVSLAVLPYEKGVQFTLSWGMTRLGMAEHAVAAVFREIGDDPTFKDFPRTPGTAVGEINIGGPSPGETIPALFETRVRMVDDGAWEVELFLSWERVKYTRWRFRVEQNGVVHRLGQTGDLPLGG